MFYFNRKYWFFPLFGFANLAIAYCIYIDALEFQQTGVDVVATVVWKFEEPRVWESSKRRKCRLEYMFELPSQKRQIATGVVSCSTFAALDVGDPIAIKYLPQNPTSTVTNDFYQPQVQIKIQFFRGLLGFLFIVIPWIPSSIAKVRLNEKYAMAGVWVLFLLGIVGVIKGLLF